MLNRHLSFQTMERSDGINQYYDHARSQQYNLERFMSVDTIVGHPTDPQTWNRNAFVFNNPYREV